MIKLSLLVHCAMLVVLAASTACLAQPVHAVVLAEDRRLISVTVTVLDPDGAPVSDVVVQVVSRNGGNEGPTGLAGAVTLTLEASPTQDDHILVRVCEGKWARNASVEQQDLYNQSYAALLEAYAFPNWRAYPITPTGSSYSIEFDVLSAVNVSGTLRDAITGDPVTLAACGVLKQSSGGFTSEAGGVFEVRAIRDSAATLVFNLPDSNEIRFLEVSAQNLTADINLGDITIALPQSNASAAISLTSVAPKLLDPRTFSRLDRHITLFDSNAERVYTFYLNEDGSKFVNVPWDPDLPNPRFAAGTYYLAPGPFSLEAALALRRALLDGKHTLLQTAGVPVLTVGSGAQGTVVFDPAAANAAILSVADQPSP
jgi:hypothetical protein